MSGGFNPVNLVSQVALGVATGGASLYAQLALQVASQIGQQVIQQLGDQLGLPQSMIDLAQGAFAGSVGDYQGAANNAQEAADEFSSAFNARPSDAGDFSREVDDAINDLVSGLSESEEFRQARFGGRGGGGGWLMAMATVLGKQLNQMAKEMESMANQISKDTPDLTAKFGALTQQFSILFQATNNAIKTAGEGLAQGAKKG